MKLWPRLLVWTGGTLTAIALGLVLWLSSLLWQSPDYASIGSCTTMEIDRTYAEIGRADAFQDVIVGRINYEFWAFHPHVQTLRGALERSVNGLVYKAFGRRKTAAFQCNHAGQHVNGTTAATLPQLVALLQPFESNEVAQWRLALCMAGTTRNIDTTANPNSGEAVRQGCALWPTSPRRARHR